MAWFGVSILIIVFIALELVGFLVTGNGVSDYLSRNDSYPCVS